MNFFAVVILIVAAAYHLNLVTATFEVLIEPASVGDLHGYATVLLKVVNKIIITYTTWGIKHSDRSLIHWHRCITTSPNIDYTSTLSLSLPHTIVNSELCRQRQNDTMPPARRLSSSSQEAFSDFCTENPPLSRRLSSNSHAASVSSNSTSRRKSIADDKGQRLLKRRSMSTSNHNYGRPKSRTSISSVQKDQKINNGSPIPKKQRTTRNNSSKSINKENDCGGSSGVECLMQSPTPYWKVAKSRGDTHSPPTTRSAKKPKKGISRALNYGPVEQESSRESKNRDGLLLFSPPNQVANAKREKVELQRKTKERDDRIEKNRKNGQLLVYSKNFDNLNPLPADRDAERDNDDNNCDDDRTHHSTETVKQKSRQNPDRMPNNNGDNDYLYNESRVVEMGELEEVSQLEEVSCLTKSTIHPGEDSKEMLTMIRGLGEKFGVLEGRLSEFSELHPPQPKRDETPNQIKELSEAKLRLEKKKEQMDLDLKSTKSELSFEREKLTKIETEFERVKSLNESLETTLNECKEKNDVLNNEVLPKTKSELKNSLEELQNYKSKLQEYEQDIERLRSENCSLLSETKVERAHFQSLNEDSHRAQQDQQQESEKKDQMIREIQQSLKLTKKELDGERSRTTELMSELQRSLNQLKDATTGREDLQRQFSDFKDEIVTKNKENNAAVGVVEEQRDSLKNRLQQLENEFKKVNEEKNDAVLRLGTSDQREGELFSRLQESDRVRKALHSRVMVLIGSIRVFVRVRPALPEELAASINEEKVFKFPTGLGAPEGDKSSKYGCDDPTKNILEVQEPFKDRGGLSQRRKKWSFGFDNLFDPSHSQEDVWEAAEPLVQCAIDGHNTTLFAYGQTGSGKTHTMLGDSGNEGIIYRSIRKLFGAKTQIEELSKGGKIVSLSVELLEIYNEQVRDLLSTKAGGHETSLKISGNKAVGSINQPVTNEAGVFKILQRAQKLRTVKATSSNATSSRSHFLFTIDFCVTSEDGTKQVGKLNVCDLAGSERLSKSGANVTGRGALLKETQNINLSLSNLSNVIEKLQNGDKNVPYRDSKLTMLLQNSLGGNSKTLCIVCANPLQTHFHETLCSLRFAAKINKVDLKSVQNFSA